MGVSIYCCWLVLLLSLNFSNVICNKIVETDFGKIEGLEILGANGKSGYSYLGIPYAKKPIGPLRFKPPEAALPWNGVLLAKQKSRACVQVFDGKFLAPPHDWFVDQLTEQSEDCLYLNIWTPNPRPVKAAVMVFIHGGGFAAGSCSLDKYDGHILSTEEDVIVVCANYRLSLFGFMYLNSTSAPGNMGLMDQTLALKWVQRNIEHFGGDPTKVTIFGESAGSISVEYHALLPTSRGLFARIIMMSGTDFGHFPRPTPSGALSNSKRVIERLNCAGSEDACHSREEAQIDWLYDKTDKDFLDAHRAEFPQRVFIFWPISDGIYVPAEKKQLFENGNLDPRIDIMIGHTREDGSFLTAIGLTSSPPNDEGFTDEEFLNLIKTATGAQNDQLPRLIQFLYQNWNQGAVDFLTDYYFACGIYSVLERVNKNGNRAYSYQFSHVPFARPKPSWLGSTHGDEIDFVFGKQLDQALGFQEEEIKLALQVMQFFASFAKYGDPTKSQPGATKWPVFTKEQQQIFDIGLETKAKIANRKQQCKFWYSIYPELKMQFENNY